MRRYMGIGFLLLILSLCYSPQLKADQEGVMRELQRLEAEFGGHLGMMAKNLRTGEVVAYRAVERFPTASVIKFPLMTAFFHLADQKLVDTSVRVVVRRDDMKPGSGVLRFLADRTSLTLLDLVKLMIIYSDNTATNLVFDQLGSTHEERLRAVNDFMVQVGLRNTRMLNKTYSWQTKQLTPESIRYGIGVSTPEEMVILLEALYKKALADTASCTMMLDIMKLQDDHDMIPRFLPAYACSYLETAHKTGGVKETKADVGLVLSDKLEMAIAIFVDKHPDHVEDIDNRAVLLAAHISRAAWNYFTGMTGYEDRAVRAHDVDWNTFPGGSWAIYRTGVSPFPHPARINGFAGKDGTLYPYFPHYCDSSVVVVVPDTLEETEKGVNLIVHFHGHLSDNMEVLERYRMPQALIEQRINALLVFPQGPYQARDSFGGKMEDEGGLARLVEDVLTTMKQQGVLKTAGLRNLIISGHSGGGRPAAFALDRGGLKTHITDVFLFDALYEQEQLFREWLLKGEGRIAGCYTDHLSQEYTDFKRSLGGEAQMRVRFTQSTVDHWQLVEEYFPLWLSALRDNWKRKPQ
jgi:beta-lactamase class A